MKRLWITLSIVATVTLITVLLFSLNKPSTTSVAQLDQPATVQGLLDAVNAERAKIGVAPLVLDERLNRSAQWKADRMIETNNFDHVDSTTGRKDGLDYLHSLDVPCSNIGENWTGDPAEKVIATQERSINSWMASTSHREAMLDPRNTSTGFGVTPYAVVEHFCQP